MATTTATIELPVPADRVWQLIGGFGSLPDWLPYIPTSEASEGGRVRTLTNEDGGVIVERLEAFDDAARTYSYSILQAPFPVTGYLSTIAVHAGKDPMRRPGGVVRHLHPGRDRRGRGHRPLPGDIRRRPRRPEAVAHRLNATGTRNRLRVPGSPPALVDGGGERRRHAVR